MSGEGRAHWGSREHVERSWPGKDVAPSPRKGTGLGVETHAVTDLCIRRLLCLPWKLVDGERLFQ